MENEVGKPIGYLFEHRDNYHRIVERDELEDCHDGCSMADYGLD